MNIAILAAVGLFVVLMAAISYAGYRFYAKPGRYFEQLGSGVFTTDETFGLSAERPMGVGVRVLKLVGEKAPVSPEDMDTTRKLLTAAGYRDEKSLAVFFGIRAISAVALFLLALSFHSMITTNTILRLLLIGGGAVLGWFLPGLILEQIVSARQERIKFALPDALDLLTVSVEAGLGLDQAMVNVARELRHAHPDLADELGLVTLEMNAGKRRADALRNLSERTRVGEVQKLVAILIQTDRFGTSMAESLRTHSDFMRIRRRQEAEERANKVGVKLVFPIFFFILPSMLVVVAGPGILQLFKQLFPMMRSIKTQLGG
jgi:tight adherence protein C